MALPSELQPTGEKEAQLLQEAARLAYSRAGGGAPTRDLTKHAYFRRAYEYFRSEAEQKEFAQYYAQAQQPYSYVAPSGEVTHVDPTQPTPTTTQPTTTYAYRHIITGEIVSADKPPSEAYKPVEIHRMGETQVTIPYRPTYEQVRGSLTVTPYKEPTTFEIVREPEADIYGRPATIKPTPFERAEYGISRTREEALQRPSIISGALAFGAGAVSVPVGLAKIPFHPVQTARGLGYAATHPFETGARIGGMIEREPMFVTGQVVGTFGTGYATAYAVPWITGFFRTIGKQKIAPEQLIEPGVLAGRKTFPTAPQKYHFQLFRKSPYKLPKEAQMGVWHATPETFGRQITIKAGKMRAGEPPGLYTAPSISPYFFRAGGKYKPFGISKISLKTPTALRIYPRGIVKGVKGRAGFAEVRGVKSEVEAIIPPSTQLVKLGARYYFPYKGIRIPITQYKVVGTGTVKTGIKTVTPKQISSYSYGYRPTPVITPYSLASPISRIAVPSYKRGIPSYTPVSKAVSYKPSYKLTPSVSYKAQPSYKVPYRTGTYYRPYYYPQSYYPPTKEPHYYPSIIEKTPPGKPIPFGFPTLMKRKKGLDKLPGRYFHYQPSLAALGLGLKAPKIPTGAITGIVTRPKVGKEIKEIKWMPI